MLVLEFVVSSERSHWTVSMQTNSFVRPYPCPANPQLTSPDDTVDMLIWSATESTATIMCSSIPVLRPLYVRFRYGSKGDSSTGGLLSLPR